MADGFLSGLGSLLQQGASGASSLLQNPSMQQLLPVALGAAGGALTSPPGTGGRGQLGRALLGASQGMMSAADAQEIGLRSQYLKAQVDALQQATKDRTTWNQTAQELLKKFPEGPDKIEFQTLAASPDPGDWSKAARLYGATAARPLSEKVITSHSTMTPDDLKGFSTDEVHKLGIKIVESGLTPEWSPGVKVTDDKGNMYLVSTSKKDGSTRTIPLNMKDPKVLESKQKLADAELLLRPRKEQMEARTKLMQQLGLTAPAIAKMKADADKQAEEFVKNEPMFKKFMEQIGVSDREEAKRRKSDEIFQQRLDEARSMAGSAVAGGGEGGGAGDLPAGYTEDPSD